MSLPLTAQRLPARKVCSLRRSTGRLLNSLGDGLYLADSALAVFRKFQKRAQDTSLHISENSMSTQGLYRIEILTTNKWNCLFLKGDGKKTCTHSSCLAACRENHTKKGKAIKQFCTSILPNVKCTPFSSAIWIRYDKSKWDEQIKIQKMNTSEKNHR